MELIAYLTEPNVLTFLLLLARLAGIFAFFPFFDNPLFILEIRAALAFYLAILFIPLLPPAQFATMDVTTFAIAVFSEILMGFLASIVLQIVFSMLSFAIETISFAMGFSMASAFDPMTQQTRPVVGQAITILALLILLESDMHHLILLYVQRSLESVPLGGLVLNNDIPIYLLEAFKNMLLVGFSMAFPIAALIFLVDIIFGMIGKTNPNFNLLVIGFPVKIAIALIVLILIVPAMMLIIKREFMSAFDALQLFLK